MRFFFDRCLSPRLARMVNAFDMDHSILHHDDDARFDEHTTDEQWLDALANENRPWIIISGDGRILKNKAQLNLLRETGFTFFCLSKQWMHMNVRREFGWKFIRVWPDIVDAADETTQKIFQITGGKTTKVELLST